MKIKSCKIFLVAFISIFMFACGDEPLTKTDDSVDDSVTLQPQAIVADAPTSKSGAPILGNPNYPAISYGAYRATERLDSTAPSVADLKEDMLILQAMGIKVLRTYNTQDFPDTANLLVAIDELMEAGSLDEMYVMLGVWVQAQGSYTSDVDNSVEDAVMNRAEMDKAIEMANAYPNIIKVIAVGNESMVQWQAHDIPVSVVVKYVKELQQAKIDGTIPAGIWITSSDNHAVWSATDVASAGQLDAIKELYEAVDYISLHSYPFHDTHWASDYWNVPANEDGLTDQQKIDAALVRAQERLVEQYAAAQAYMLSIGVNKPIHIGETGWATVGSPGGEDFTASGSAAADEYKQKVVYDALRAWSEPLGISVFFFEAFDEQWKAGTENPATHPEKHFGMIDMDGKAKYLLWDQVDAGVFDGLTRGGNAITKSYGGDVNAMMADVFVPPSAPVVVVPDGAEYVLFDTALADAFRADGWDGTAFLGEATDALQLTPPSAGGTIAGWGWGAGVTLQATGETDLSLYENGSLQFDIKGTTTTAIDVGFITGVYQWPDGGTEVKSSVVFGPGGRPLTSEFVTYKIPVSELNTNGANFSDVTSLFYFSGTAEDAGTIEIKNISWLE
jgi:exo-beta-1,3-glucanase (GH17 family)